MNKPTNTSLMIRSSLALALALAIWSPAQVRSAEPAEGKMKMKGKMMMETDMKQRCQAMKEQKEKLAADLKTQDVELSAQIAEMNSAAEDKKLDLMAGIITQMVAQRTALNARRAGMDEGMMKHMMQHMQMGKESMAQCPMMKGMKGVDEKSADANDTHKEIQTEEN